MPDFVHASLTRRRRVHGARPAPLGYEAALDVTSKDITKLHESNRSGAHRGGQGAKFAEHLISTERFPETSTTWTRSWREGASFRGVNVRHADGRGARRRRFIRKRQTPIRDQRRSECTAAHFGRGLRGASRRFIRARRTAVPLSRSRPSRGAFIGRCWRRRRAQLWHEWRESKRVRRRAHQNRAAAQEYAGVRYRWRDGVT